MMVICNYYVFSVRSGQVRNLDSARVSMVGQIKRYLLDYLLVLHTTESIFIKSSMFSRGFDCPICYEDR